MTPTHTSTISPQGIAIEDAVNQMIAHLKASGEMPQHYTIAHASLEETLQGDLYVQVQMSEGPDLELLITLPKLPTTWLQGKA